MIEAFHALNQSFRAGKGGLDEHFTLQRAGTNGMAIRDTLRLAAYSIDHNGNFTVFNGVHNMRATFAYFVDDLRHNAVE